MKKLTAFYLGGLRRREDLLDAVDASSVDANGEMHARTSLELASLLLAHFQPDDGADVRAATLMVERFLDDAGEPESTSAEIYSLLAIVGGLGFRMDEEDSSKAASDIHGLFLREFPWIGDASNQNAASPADAAVERPRA